MRSLKKFIGERRIAALRDLGARTGEAKTAEEACAIAAEGLAGAAKDVPFALVYLVSQSGKLARLASAAGVEIGEPAAPIVIDLDPLAAAGARWPLKEALRKDATVTVENLAGRFQKIPRGPWSDPPHTALVVPIRSNTAHRLAGFLVIGVSSRLKLDNQYRSFLELAGAQIGTAIATARAYEEERKRAEALAEIDRAKTLFFSNVSHEFRTPLTLLLGPLEEVLADAALSAADRERLDLAHRNSIRLLKLVNSLLDFSRIEAGRMQATYEPVDLASLTAEIASNFRSACQRAGLKLIVDCPPLAGSVYVDREMWEKIVLNLLSNAFKFTFEGEISVRLAARDGTAVLVVSDTGVGIPEHELPRLFERFHRIEGQKSRTYEGSGIGLALVKELVRLHGGRIRAEIHPGKGTSFIIDIPLGTARLPADRIGSQPQLAPTSFRPEAYVEEALRWVAGIEEELPIASEVATEERPTREGGRVLVADDNADMRTYVSRLLSDRWEVETVSDGQAALEALRRRGADLVLADVMMPRLDGFALLKAIRKDSQLRDIPVVMLSARAGKEATSEGLSAGADDYLIKPFTAQELIARVRGSLKTARIRHEAVAEAQRREQRKSFLLHLSDALREPSGPKRIMATAARMLGKHLGAGRAGYGEIDAAQEYITVEQDWTAPEMPSFAGRHRLDSFGRILIDELRNGRTVRLDDALADTRALSGGIAQDIADAFAAINTRSGIAVPLIKDGRWLAVFYVHRSEPRCWTDDEVSLVEEVAERTWAVVERGRAETRQQVLIRELNHRVKNTLTMVQSLTSQTLRANGVGSAVQDSIEARLVALSKGHDLLTKGNWEGAEMRRIVSTALAPFRSERDRVRIEGPVVHIHPKAALSLTMGLNELATNATKYGALSNDEGRVEVTWRIEGIEKPRFCFLWAEHGGPTVKSPDRKGFGSRLIERSLSAEFGGEVRLEYSPGGVRCAIDVPLANVWAVTGEQTP